MYARELQAVGPSLVLLNKHILSNVGFKYPMLLSSLGLIFSAVTAHLVRWRGGGRVVVKQVSMYIKKSAPYNCYFGVYVDIDVSQQG